MITATLAHDLRLLSSAGRRSVGHTMVRFFQLLIRPIDHFLVQWLLISTQPSAFVRECIQLGDTTNFIRAGKFFLSAIAAAFLAEVATSFTLGLKNVAEPYYWLVFILTAIPFVLFCFLLVRLVSSLSFKDVLHLSLYPVGAGIFAGAALTLVASAALALLVAVGYIADIKIDYTQWAHGELGDEIFQGIFFDCLRQQSLIFTVVAAGLGEAYDDLKPPIDDISYIRPVLTVLYLIIAARFFGTVVARRKRAVFCLVLLAAFGAAIVDWLGIGATLRWAARNTNCEETSEAAGIFRTGESSLKELAREIQADLSADAKDDDPWTVYVRAEGRTLIYTYRFKEPILDMAAFYRRAAKQEKELFENCCSDSNEFFVDVRASETYTYYSVEGERLTSFSIDRSDCQKW